MNMRDSKQVGSEIELFWSRHGAEILSKISTEISCFLTQAPVAHEEIALMRLAAARNVAAPAGRLPRERLYRELVDLYAQAMEYPAEVFSESVELESELGIDSVKQTEIISRVRARYQLPPLPQDFRMADCRTMGQIVDFVHAHQGLAAQHA